VTVTRDAGRPTIFVTTPTSGATYTQGVSFVANYWCADAVSGIATCSGAVATGAPIDTNSIGPATFSVTAIDAAGNTTTLDVSYQITASGGGSTGTGGGHRGGGGATDPWSLLGLALIGIAAAGRRRCGDAPGKPKSLKTRSNTRRRSRSAWRKALHRVRVRRRTD
jgi:hypothetical protein